MTVDQAATELPPADHRAVRRRNRILLVAFLVAAIAFAVHAWSAMRGYFRHDDFVIMYRAAQASAPGLDYLFQSYNQEHVAPGKMLLAWVLVSIAPLNFPTAALVLLGMLGVTFALFWRLLSTCFGTRWALLPGYVTFTFSPLILLPTLWWAYGVELLPLLLAMVGALDSHVRYVRGGNTRLAVQTVLWTVAGLAFYEKAVLIPALLLGITVLLSPPGQPSSVGWALRQFRTLWITLAVLVAGYLLLYLAVTGDKPRLSDDRPLEVGQFLYRAVIETLLPGLFGGPLSGVSVEVAWDRPPLAMVIASGVLAAGIVLAGIQLGRKRAMTAWFLLAGYLAVDLALVATSRLQSFGSVVGTDPRYLGDAVPVAVLCATFAILAPVTTTEPEHPVGVPPSRPARWLIPATAVLTVAVATAATISHTRLAPALQSGTARDYVAHARLALAADPTIILYDGPVPDQVLLSWFLDDARASRVVGLVPERPRFDLPAETLHMLDGNGVPRPITGLVDTVTSPPGPAKDCGYLVDQRTTVIPLSTQVTGRRLMRLEYYTADTGPAVVTVAGRKTEVTVEQGLHVLYMVVEGSFVRVDINRTTAVAPVCVANVVVGQPRT